ncbi:carboxypeptidase M32 [Rhodothermus profundi]|nr:carboxypeptidase M32 [Rhodothermus profundi]
MNRPALFSEHPALSRLCAHLARIADVRAAAALLEWDQETYMPSGATGVRAEQLSTLHRLAHEWFISEETGVLLEAAAAAVSGWPPDDLAVRLVAVVREDYDRARRLPPELVAALARTETEAREAWKQARQENNYMLFAPYLEQLLNLNREKAEALGYEAHPYDALLEQYEPGMTTADVQRLFEQLRAHLVPLVQELGGQSQPAHAFLHRHVDAERQWKLNRMLLEVVGFDLQRGRLDASVHPFSTGIAISDVRLTTRIDPHDFTSGLFATLHEAGHGLYEQGIDPALERTPLADGASLGLHESQSRLWENLIGRSLPFWEYFFPHLQRLLEGVLDDVSLEAFYRAINRVQPSLIRVEADEVTYNLHILLRFELELALLEDSLSVQDLPEAWNDRMQCYLGLRPVTFREGVLQDIHWSQGAFGYFPTYTLGNLMSAQLWEALEQEIADVAVYIRRGDFHPVLAWLRQQIHRYGRAWKAPVLLQQATGNQLRVEPWLAYIRKKYQALYPTASVSWS